MLGNAGNFRGAEEISRKQFFPINPSKRFNGLRDAEPRAGLLLFRKRRRINEQHIFGKISRDIVDVVVAGEVSTCSLNTNVSYVMAKYASSQNNISRR